MVAFRPYGNSSRDIVPGPLYDPADVLNLLKNAQTINFWTSKCGQDVQKLAFDQEDVCELLRSAIVGGTFKNSEWCVQRPDGPWAACDAYCVNRLESIPTRHTEVSIEYYLKFAISLNGNALLVAYCHS